MQIEDNFTNRQKPDQQKFSTVKTPKSAKEHRNALNKVTIQQQISNTSSPNNMIAIDDFSVPHELLWIYDENSVNYEDVSDFAVFLQRQSFSKYKVTKSMLKDAISRLGSVLVKVEEIQQGSKKVLGEKYQNILKLKHEIQENISNLKIILHESDNNRKDIIQKDKILDNVLEENGLTCRKKQVASSNSSTPRTYSLSNMFKDKPQTTNQDTSKKTEVVTTSQKTPMITQTTEMCTNRNAEIKKKIENKKKKLSKIVLPTNSEFFLPKKMMYLTMVRKNDQDLDQLNDLCKKIQSLESENNSKAINLLLNKTRIHNLQEQKKAKIKELLLTVESLNEAEKIIKDKITLKEHKIEEITSVLSSANSATKVSSSIHSKNSSQISPITEQSFQYNKTL